MVRVTQPTTVVSTKDVAIDEYFGGASCDPCNGDISFAHVKASGGWNEEWQAPAFDEYTLILKGSITIEHSHGPPVTVKAGQAVFLAKGERVRWVFHESAEYVPICLPAFNPGNCFREEGPGAGPPTHDAHKDIYHLVQKKLWDKCKAAGAEYFPPTYEQDGFTHATADPSKLLVVANYFYKDVHADWLCLKMTRHTLDAAGITLKFEDPSPVGNKKALTSAESGGERFPHIYGGIPTTGGVVIQEYVVNRAADGEYLSITGLCDGPSEPATPALATRAIGAITQAATGLIEAVTPTAIAFGAVGALVGFAVARARA